jgi:Transcriptional regulator PadR-like family
MAIRSLNIFSTPSRRPSRWSTVHFTWHFRRLERKGWVNAKWETARDGHRQFKYYRLTAAGLKQLSAEESRWKRLASAISRVMWPASEE